MKLSMKHSWRLSALLIALIVGCAGALLLITSHAATPTSSVEAEAGTVTTATKVTDASASNGGAIKFGSGTVAGSNVKPTIVGHQLNLGTTGMRLKMRGAAVWGIEDSTTTSFGVNEYNNRQTIVNTIKSWGGNDIRLRLLATTYDNQTYMTKAQEIQEIKDWQSTADAAGMYLHITWWDALDGPYSQANWATQYSNAFPMMTDVVHAMGNDPRVIYEPFNEPDNVTEAQWLTAMKATVQLYRNTLGYTGILLIDTDGWSHMYNDADMTALEQLDASSTGMNGKNQLIFSKHDYANESYANPDSGFDSTHWPQNSDGSGTWDFSKHIVWETEFGNYNGDPSTVHLAWSQGAASWMAAKVNDATLAGADAFVWGPWYDVNAITSSDNVTATQWGGYVKTNFLQAVN